MKVFKATQKETNSLTERVYRKLRNAIITGEIKGGTRLVESSLAGEMNVSRTPIREALNALALEGLLYSIPRAGYIVEEMSDYDVKDLFTTRLTIEQIAACQAMEKISAEELKLLEHNIQQTDTVIQAGLTQKVADLDIEFHGILYKATRSRALLQICQTLSDHTLKYRIALIHFPEMSQKTRDGHLSIFEALLSGDSSQVKAAIRSHLQLAQEDIMALLERRRHEAFITTDSVT
ncbi:MAG: GntR family transcriptional regulator [Deltaproteobacteria bacterium]